MLPIAVHVQALALGIPSGKHLLYANRAGARLTLGDKQGAMEDANEAAACGPPSFTTAYVRQARRSHPHQPCAGGQEIPLKIRKIPHLLCVFTLLHD